MVKGGKTCRWKNFEGCRMEYETFFMDIDEGNHDEYVRRRKKKGALIKCIYSSSSCVDYTMGVPSARMGYSYHRLDGPACIELHRNEIMFMIKDKHFNKTQIYCKAAEMSDEETLMWVLRFGDELPKTCEGFYGEDWQSMSLDQF